MKKARASNRICEASDELNNHFKLFEKGTNAKSCEICGEKILCLLSKCNDVCALVGMNWNEDCMLAVSTTIILWTLD